MKTLNTGLGIAGLLFSMAAGAGAMGEPGQEPPLINTASCGKLITLSFGPAWYNQGEDVRRDFRFPLVHTFVPNKVSGVVGSSEIFFALTRPLDNYVSGQLGIALGYSGNAKQEGNLYIGDPAISVSAYGYRLSNARITLKGKLLAEWPYFIKPYASASGGVGFNRSWNYGYREPATFIRPYMDDNTVVAFSYTAGLGLQADVNRQWQVGVGYEFADWGKNNFARLRLQPNVAVHPFLHSGTFYTNSVQLSVTYRFSDAPVYA